MKREVKKEGFLLSVIHTSPGFLSCFIVLLLSWLLFVGSVSSLPFLLLIILHRVEICHRSHSAVSAVHFQFSLVNSICVVFARRLLHKNPKQK